MGIWTPNWISLVDAAARRCGRVDKQQVPIRLPGHFGQTRIEKLTSTSPFCIGRCMRKSAYAHAYIHLQSLSLYIYIYTDSKMRFQHSRGQSSPKLKTEKLAISCPLKRESWNRQLAISCLRHRTRMRTRKQARCTQSVTWPYRRNINWKIDHNLPLRAWDFENKTG